MGTDLVVGQEAVLTPDEVIVGATNQAKLLMSIVEQTKCYQEISGKKYLQVEAWETIGAFNRTHAETESVTPILKDNETIGYQAHVQLFKDGVIVGGAIMPCYFTENCCKGKEGDAKHKSAMSAAQTFATSKAYRMNFSYIAILAGFQPLPAEEVTSDMVDKTKHWCPIHDTAFFKRGRMKWYAHKIEGTDGWCSEEQVEKQTAESIEEPSTKPPPQATTSTGEAPNTDLSSLVFKNAGEIYLACKVRLKMNLDQSGAALAGFDLATEQGRAEAWAKIVKDHEEKSDEEKLFE